MLIFLFYMMCMCLSVKREGEGEGEGKTSIDFVWREKLLLKSSAVTGTLNKIFPLLWKLDLIWREFQSQPKARSKKLKQTSQLRRVPVRCLSRDFLFSCTCCAGPCKSLRAANSWSQSSYSSDITLPVQCNCKFCTKPKENITSTITGFMFLEAET